MNLLALKWTFMNIKLPPMATDPTHIDIYYDMAKKTGKNLSTIILGMFRFIKK